VHYIGGGGGTDGGSLGKYVKVCSLKNVAKTWAHQQLHCIKHHTLIEQSD